MDKRALAYSSPAGLGLDPRRRHKLISRTASRNALFSSARIGKALNVDRVPPLNDGPQHGTQFGSSSDDLQAFIDEFDLMISNQDAMQL